MTTTKKPSKPAKKSQYNIYVPPQMRQKIERIASTDGVTKAEIYRNFLRSGIEQWETKHGEIEL